MAIAAIVVAGCYSLRPLGGVDPAPGTKLAFDVNDAGRVALGSTMGPEIGRIEGRLVKRDGDDYLLAVSVVKLLRGGEQAWSGEQVRLSPGYLGNGYERRFSLARSVGVGVVAAGGVGLFFASRSLLGFGTDPEPGPQDTLPQRLGRP